MMDTVVCMGGTFKAVPLYHAPCQARPHHYAPPKQKALSKYLYMFKQLPLHAQMIWGGRPPNSLFKRKKIHHYDGAIPL